MQHGGVHECHSLAENACCSTALFPNATEEQRVQIQAALLQLWRTGLNRKNGQIECVPVR